MKVFGRLADSLKNKLSLWIVLCFAASFITILPYIILGEGAVVTYHDQLDGEIVTYLLNARHMFDGLEYYEEIANGISVNGMVSPAPGLIILFRLFKPYTAFVISVFIKQIFSICFAFLLFEEITHKKVLSFTAAFIFMLLPFYTVYGLSIPGQMMLVYALLELRKDKKPYLPYFWIFLYAVFSSLPLGGFMVIIDLGVLFLIMLIKKEKPFRFFAATGIVCLVYAFENVGLVKQLLGIAEGFVSHKSEILYYPADSFLGNFFSLIFKGDLYYCKDYHKYYAEIIIAALIAVAVIGIKKRDYLKSNKQIKALWISSAYILLMALLDSTYESGPVTEIVNNMTGVVHDFNFTRILWTFPCAWFTAFVVSVSLLYDLLESIKVRQILIKRVYSVVIAGVMGITLFAAVYENDLRFNLHKLVNPDYEMITWEQFFAADLFEQVDRLIGLPKEDYRVVSYGIYPAAASANGFYCLDMYSNNYDVEYKHLFRNIIAEELEKSDYNKSYYDNWGNRCYIIQDSTGYYCTFQKKWTPYSKEFNLNFDALKDMGCHYLISASYIMDCEKYGLTLLNPEAAIESENSWFWLWVYEF